MSFHLREFSLVLLIAVAGCKKDAEGAPGALPPAAGEGAPPAAALPKIDTDAPPLGSGPQDARTTGSTFAVAEAKVGPKVSGVIAKIFVIEGTVVKKGDPLFRQDARS